MRYLILILKDFGYPFLERTLTDVKLAGIEVIPVLAVNDELLTDVRSAARPNADEILSDARRDSAFIVTDCAAGIGMAREHGTGFVYVEEDGAEPPDVSGAQCIIQGFEEVGADFLIKMYERFHHLPWTILKTERLILREMTVDDVDRLYEIYAEPGITDFTEPLYEDRLQEIGYTKDYIRNMYEFCGYGLWLVLEKSGRIVGRAGITGREGYDEAELGYVIERSRQRRGYAAEACRAIIRYAADVLEMKGLNCFVQPGNEASVKLCKLLGFEHLDDVKISGCRMLRYHLDL